MLEKYGGTYWTNDEPAPENSPYRLAGGLAAGVIATGAAVKFGMSDMGNGHNGFDYMTAGVRVAANFTPMGLGGTFRAPEFLSPFTSNQYRNNFHEFDPITYKNRDTYQYLQDVTGYDSKKLTSMGFAGDLSNVESLKWEHSAETGGHLLAKIGDKEHILGSNVRLMEANPDTLGISGTGPKKTNRALLGVMQALGFTKRDGANPDNVFSSFDGTKSRYVPIPGPKLDFSSAAALNRGTAYPRSFFAFGMNRLNDLVEGSAEQVPFVGDLTKGAGKLFGDLSVQLGTGSEMFVRHGGKAAMVAAGLGLAAQADWFRRDQGSAGHVAVSAGFSGLAYAAARKLDFSPKASMFAATASFFGQMALPGFDQGILPGIASTYTTGLEMRAAFSPISHYRRGLEGFAPGISDWKTGALLGLGVAGFFSGADIPMLGMTGTQLLSKKFSPSVFGIRDDPSFKPIQGSSSLFWENMKGKIHQKVHGLPTDQANDMLTRMKYYDQRKGYPVPLKKAIKLYHGYKTFTGADPSRGGMTFLRELSTTWSQTMEQHRSLVDEAPINREMVDKVRGIASKYAGKTDPFSVVERKFHMSKEVFRHSLWGGDVSSKVAKEAFNELNINPKLGKLGVLFGATMAVHQIATGGIFGSMESAEDLRDIHQGRKLIKVGRGRAWEAGGTPFEGDLGGYYRPHWYSLMMNRTREKGIWGPGEDEISPIKKFFTKNFTYDLERAQYYDRPYPITNAAFQDVPVIGSILASTVGRFIKPAKLMHTGEWAQHNGSEAEFMHVNKGFRNDVSMEMGSTGPGNPVAPLASRRVLGETVAKFREMEGLTGWMKNILSNFVLGQDEYGNEKTTLASSADMTSGVRRFWESQMGGMLFSNEAIRRFMPTPFGGKNTYNPIGNSMPMWLPEKFRRGDPYRLVEWGEARLPGSGYSSLHKELRGLDPEAYPLVYQYSILADVASGSEEFRRVRGALYARRSRGETSEGENQLIDSTDNILVKKSQGYTGNHLREGAITLPGSSITRGVWAGGQKLLREVAAPAEYLVPMGFRPVQKLLSDRDPMEQYEYERLYGTKQAFWDKPWRDWFRPAITSAGHLAGFNGKPRWRQEADNLQGKFDQLEFVKWMKLAEQAEAAGDTKSATQYAYLASNTRSGVDPNGSAMSIYWSLPDEERPFFNAFATADKNSRSRILDMIPEDQQHLYKALWQRVDSGDETLWAGDKQPPNMDYMRHRMEGLAGAQVPREDWVGYNEDVDLGDIKIQYLDNLGKELHDFGEWEASRRKVRRQPFLGAATDQLSQQGDMSSYGSLVRGTLNSMLGSMGNRGSVSASTLGSGGVSANIQMNDNRQRELMEAMRYE